MYLTGKDLIQKIVEALKKEGKLCYDSAIIAKIESLTIEQLKNLLEI